MNTVSIRASNINVTMGTHPILHDVSISFRKGELTILLGPNGAGKSSFLKAVTQEWPANGNISYFGKDASQWNKTVLARHLGVLPQSSSLTFNFTAREVVELGALPLKASQPMIQDIAIRTMQQTDILHLADRLYPSLSGGEKQRVHLARVLTQLEQSGKDKILLLDEPTSALDLSHQHNTLKLAKSLARQGASVIAVIHDLNLAAQYADRILVMNHGQLVTDGTPWEVLTEQTIRDVYHWEVTVIPHPSSSYPVILSQ
ncbi:heme ABC transporter ATP-binding protein [Vibrio albus]|uniref:Heme ABC transporter ATP-binding protein n=1 Tax=Vibrio albus TaxID=2200953 RepID=A0A2U3BE04_9VIBR|nr:heme ABC transporter ATP-binding protein [Vibrio albus]PWI35010.1 heme ABC transporter ATP-binding protein [Vibrio albus]